MTSPLAVVKNGNEGRRGVHYRETSLVTRLVTSKVLVIGARNGFARNDLVTTS